MNITNHITARGISREEVCKQAGISRSYLSLIEAGERKVGVGKVKDLASALGIKVADLRPDLAHLFSSEASTPEDAA